MTAYPGYIPEGELRDDSYIVSPSGLYYAVMQDDGNLVIAHGTDPATDAGVQNNALWSTWGSAGATPPNPLYLSFAEINQYPWWALAGESSNSTTADYWESGKVTYDISAYYLSLSDNGTLTLVNGISPGNNGPGNGAVVWSSNSSDPETSIDLTSINYDFNNAVYSNPTTLHSAETTLVNNTDTTEVFPLTLTLSHTATNTFNWSLSEAVSLGIKSTTSVGMPGVGSESLEESLSETTTISAGQSTSETEQETYSQGITVTVPPHSTYAAYITAAQDTGTVPYTFSGTAHYKSGKTAPVHGTGNFVGVDASEFTAEVDDVTPGKAPSVVMIQPGSSAPVASAPTASLSSTDPAAPTPPAGLNPTSPTVSPPDLGESPALDAAPINLGSGPDTLSFAISEDAWHGDARFTVSIDCKQVGCVQTVKALRDDNQTQIFNVSGDFKDIAHTVAIDFLNDAYGGTPQTDRNLYVDQVLINGVNVPEGVISQYTQGSHSFSFLASHFEINHPADLTAVQQAISGSGADPSQSIFLDWSTGATRPSADDAGWVKASIDASGNFSVPVNIDHAGVEGTLYYRVGSGPVTAAWSDTPAA